MNRRHLALAFATAAALLLAAGAWQLLARTASDCGARCDADTTYRGGLLTLGGLALGAVAALLWPGRPDAPDPPSEAPPSSP